MDNDLNHRRQPLRPKFVVVTPAHNEEAFIERAILSMIGQTARPTQWIVVNDGSTDRTRDIVARYAAAHPFITLVDMVRSGERHFGNKVHAFNLGLSQCRTDDYEYIGNLDADITLDHDYYELVLLEFSSDARLGIAGGMVSTRIGGEFVSQEVALDSVAGAVQLFRRACYEQIGGYRPLPRGGIDSAAEIIARMHGWRTCTFPKLRVLEHRRTGTATRPPLASRVNEGRRYHSLGYGFLFLTMRCIYRALERPRLIGSLATFIGYLQASFLRSPIALPPDAVRFLRTEQHGKLMRSFRSVIQG
jgi:poly-beta-1,6-N-acetyl-D-glucosamine synthase